MNNGIKFITGSLLLLVFLIYLINDKPSNIHGTVSDKPLLVYCAAGIKPAVLPVAKQYEKEFGK